MDPLSRTFAALADPTRRAMLARLAQGEANVSQLAEPFLASMSLPAVTKHLKVLESAGLVHKGRNAQWRPCRLNGEPLREANGWMEQYRAAWEEQLDRLGAYLQTSAAQRSAEPSGAGDPAATATATGSGTSTAAGRSAVSATTKKNTRRKHHGRQ